MSDGAKQTQSEPVQTSSGLLEALSQVEGHIRALKRAQSEHSSSNLLLENKQREILAKSQAFEAERSQVHARESDLVDRGRELDQQRSELDTQRNELRTRVADLQQQRQDMQRQVTDAEKAGSDRERQLSRLSEALGAFELR